MTADVLIVADQSDLNIYKTASKEKTALGCCSPESKASGCNAAVKRSSKSENIDLNEWAGKRSQFNFLMDLVVLTCLQHRSRYMLLSHRVRNRCDGDHKLRTFSTWKF